MRLIVDGNEADRKKAPKKVNVLSTAYVGGQPETNSLVPLAGSQVSWLTWQELTIKVHFVLTQD